MMRMVPPLAFTLDNTVTSVAETATAWDSGATFAKDDVAYRTIGGIHRQFVSQQDGNQNHTPETDDGTWWLDAGGTNAWAMFDGTLQNRTLAANAIEIVRQLGADEQIDHVRLANIDAAQAQVILTDYADGVVYDRTVELVSDSGIQDWYRYFTEPVVRARGLTLSDLPGMYSGAELTIRLIDYGGTPACGLCLIGLGRQLGRTRFGTELGFRDLSVKSEDAFGNISPVERGYKRTARFDILVPAGFADELQRLAEDYRATPVLLIGSDTYDTMAIYGFIKSFRVVAEWKPFFLCSLEVESLA